MAGSIPAAARKKGKRIVEEMIEVFRKVFTGIAGIVFICSLLYLIHQEYLRREHITDQEEMEELFSKEDADALVRQISSSDISDAAEVSAGEDFMEKTLAPAFRRLQEVNKDVAGMFMIPDTGISYPVLQKDNRFYLDHNIYGEPDIYGSIFMDENCTRTGSSFILFGHAMKDGTMFGELKKYQNPDYLEKHSTAYLYTEYEKYTYKLSVLVLGDIESLETLYQTFPFSTVSSAEPERCWKFWDAVAECTGKDMSGTGTDEGGILMLATCAYHEEDGRLLLIGTQVRSD